MVNVDFVEILTRANILLKSNTKYYFAEKNYLAYFVAREIKRKCLEEQDFTEFNKALEYACYGINADILLFVTYITDNLNLIRALLDKAEECTAEWEEFSLNPIKIPYLSDVEQLEVTKATEEDKGKEEEEEIQREKKIERAKEKQAMFETGAKSVIEKILPVIDNFERGFATVEPEDEKDAFVEGMRMVYKQMMNELEKIDVKPIEAVGKEFDPALHNAVMQVQSEEYEPGIVAQELQKGYTYRDTVVRYSMVAVVSE